MHVLDQESSQKLIQARIEWSKNPKSYLVQADNFYGSLASSVLISVGFLLLAQSFSFIQFLIGILIMTFFEYVSHRWTFHSYLYKKLSKGELPLTHLSHHAQTEVGINASWLIPFLYIPIYYLVSSLVMFSFQNSFSVAAGFALGYGWYEVSHRLIHMKNPPTRYYKWMRDFHAVHHHRNWKKNFGITSPIWDYVFGSKI